MLTPTLVEFLTTKKVFIMQEEIPNGQIEGGNCPWWEKFRKLPFRKIIRGGNDLEPF